MKVLRGQNLSVHLTVPPSFSHGFLPKPEALLTLYNFGQLVLLNWGESNTQRKEVVRTCSFSIYCEEDTKHGTNGESRRVNTALGKALHIVPDWQKSPTKFVCFLNFLG